MKKQLNSFKLNPLHALDSYKLGHQQQYPKNTQFVYSNFTPRSAKLSTVPIPLTEQILLWFGIQGTLKEMVAMWNEGFFQKDKEEVLKAHIERIKPFTGNDNPDVSHIAALWDLGYLPLEIKSLPEGSKVPMGVPVFTIVNTHPDFGWLTNSTETYLSNESWKPTTVATIAHAYRNLMLHFAEITGAPKEFVDWQGHCFADRGMSGMMDAAKSCAGHSLSFLGSDSVSAVDWLEYAYGAKGTFISGSVPATEHSIMCAGNKDSEIETIRRLLEDLYPSGVVSIVADTWDFWKVVTEYATLLKDKILTRTPNAQGLAKVVFRPDSGDPVRVICGDHIEDLSSAENLEIAKSWFEEILVDQERENVPHGEHGNTEVQGIFIYNSVYYKLVVEMDWNRHDKQYYYIDDSSIKSCEETIPTPEQKGAVQCLWEIFGGTTTDKGFKVLNERVGLIYGDSINLERAKAILEGLKAKGFASNNIVFGIGSFTYQYLTRDTFGMAMKATYAVIDGVGTELFKDPITDIGKTKKSAKGLLRVEKENGKFVLYDQQTPEQETKGELRTVFKNGNFYNRENFAEIKQRLTQG